MTDTTDAVDAWCQLCRAFHPAEVLARDVEQFPSSVRWLVAHDRDDAGLLEMLDPELPGSL